MKSEKMNTNPVFQKLSDEKHEDFFDYIQGLGLADDPNVVILSAMHHYYYDSEELKDVKTVINLKQLNNVRQVKDFLQAVSHVLPEESNFIGSFTDNRKNHGSRSSDDPELKVAGSISTRIPFLNRLFNLFDLRTERHLTTKTASILLEDAVLKVVDMKEVDGLTYFCTKKIKASA